MDELKSKIDALEREIAGLPQGYISKKNIAGKIRQYFQWTENGKKKSKYIDDAAAEILAHHIERRRSLQRELKTLKTIRSHKVKTNGKLKNGSDFITTVLIGDTLAAYVRAVSRFKARACLSDLQNYLYETEQEKVFILYGLRRTGKTTLIRQAIAAMDSDDFNQTAFIQVRTGTTLADVNRDLQYLQQQGFRYIFIDEATFMSDFIEGAALFSDIYAASGMKIVLSGTDSLGFLFSEDEQLYDRCILLHTTWIPYKEFESVLGIHGIDAYIRYGGTMSLGGVHYNEKSTFSSVKSADVYVDSAIAHNIQHSLRCYQNAGHFRSLQSLYEKNELTGAINRIVEDINHRFTLEVLIRNFESHDLGVSARNLRHDREHPTNILDLIDKKAVTERLKTLLEIRNKDEQSVCITDAHRLEIREYLELLDLIVDIPIEKIPVSDDKSVQPVISQPGLRYAQAKALVEQLMMDVVFQSISAEDRTWIIERILNEVRGRMMEEIVLLETKMAFPEKKVFKLQFAIGEFDMVITDPKSTTCEIYEIKHSTKIAKAQYRHLIDEKKCADTAFRFGQITGKYVLYRGPGQRVDGIVFQNVEEYLMALGE